LLQDSALIQRLNSVLTRRVIKFLLSEAKKDPNRYNEFFQEFGNFIKEGTIRDAENREALASLLRMDSSALSGDQKVLTSLDEYVSRMKEDQKDIYYLVTGKRAHALSSPYFEGFKRKSIEVLFFYTPLDDAVINYVQSFKGKNFVAIESANINDPAPTPETEPATEEAKLSEEEITDFQKWIKDTLSEKVSSVKVSTRLHESPAIVIDNESASFRRMMRLADPMVSSSFPLFFLLFRFLFPFFILTLVLDKQRAPTIPKQAMEINVKHPLMIQLNKKRSASPAVAASVLEQVPFSLSFSLSFSRLSTHHPSPSLQIFDNALISAGLLDDTRSMIPRINKIMEDALRV